MNRRELPDRFRAPIRVDGTNDRMGVVAALLAGFALGLIVGAAFAVVLS